MRNKPPDGAWRLILWWQLGKKVNVQIAIESVGVTEEETGKGGRDLLKGDDRQKCRGINEEWNRGGLRGSRKSVKFENALWMEIFSYEGRVEGAACIS